MGNRVADRVVLLGGSMCGLLAARVLADAFAEVVIVDRDDLTDVTGPRRGVPHGRHAHGLVARGHQILEGQFPGLTEQMRAAGVEPGDFNGDIRWYVNGRRLKPSRSGLVSVPATRPVLEHHVRLRVRNIPNVVFMEGYDVAGLATTPDGDTVTGARIQRRAEGSREEVLDADLVIDATGRGSRAPAWLADLGYARPEEERVTIGLAYTTRHYRLRSDPFGDDLAIIPAPTPDHPRGAFFYKLPGYGGRIELSLTGMLGDHPPADPEGFEAFARSLPVPEIYEAIRDAEPLDDPVTFRFPASVWRHYERLGRFPERLLVMGDAVCSFNPLYAQGMTVTALESLTLRRHLASGRLPRPAAFLRDVAANVRGPWEFSAGADLGYPGAEGRRTPRTRLANAYVARLQSAAVHDARLGDAFIRAAGLIDPPQALLRPANVARVLRHMWRRPAEDDPETRAVRRSDAVADV
ncbi:FAD-binding monooxygenase [Microbispora cellulosiformans]|uniref:FAD-binding monooxygenase n=1 Tax=Microbispora cellulosiformans TaxID=2614688 RepID=A0A5J5K0W1_9ACTN|nr:FAD-dependent monooxygenase [Microbispora cellulosiformans]KAA9377617.1 FAD-binding monooxygenase [Microbispora cellulosiformans]